MSREYLKHPQELSTVTMGFSKSITKFYQLAIMYSELEKSQKLNFIQRQTELKKRTEDIFEGIVSEIRKPHIREIGSMENKQVFMYPVGSEKILKLDVSRGDVRTLHIYDLEKKQTYSLSQSSLKITMATTPFQRIFGIQEMDDNWKKLRN